MRQNEQTNPLWQMTPVLLFQPSKVRPGIYSARYSGKGDAANNEKLLRALEGIEGAGRNAFYVAVIALVKHASDPMPIIAEGRWHGRIAKGLVGEGGFGYDPLFIPRWL
jgi:XTP/dITP diphosphohydrolase